MESKPLITYGGDKLLFGSLEIEMVQGLPSESIEWRRSYGRAPKTVCVEAQFIPFKEENLPPENVRTLMGQAFLHTFWTGCTDIDAYKTTVKEDISIWLTKLKMRSIHDWMIVLVEGVDSKKGGKAKLLPRASVLDKIRSDFCSKQPDRCIAFLKSDARSAESWQGLLQRTRHLLLQAYNRNLGRFEENMRSQRERRNELGWNFCDYFLLQEELAFVFEMLGIYDEALVQYDELDALFTQFVINSNSGDTPDWLTSFSGPCICWEGLALTRNCADDKRVWIREGKASLLDLRNYLFSRQCALLLLLFRPWEVAQRSLTFMHSCINELQILEVEMPEGAVACWVFLSCLEVLQTCERFNDSSHVEAYSRYTAGLWAYARSKLQELGELCGLMPDKEATSEQLHHVVELVAGMGYDQNLDDQCPLVKLKEALSSKEAFQKYYLELSELAMGTFKHIGRLRSARLIGRDLAEFYSKLGNPQKSASLLLNALKTFQEEQWPLLIAETQMQIALCYEAMQDRKKYIKMATQVACNPHLSDIIRIDHFTKVLMKMDELEECNEKLDLLMDDVIQVTAMSVVMPSNVPFITIDSTVQVKLTLHSRLPKKLTCEAVIVAMSQNMDEASPEDEASRVAVAKAKLLSDDDAGHVQTKPSSEVPGENVGKAMGDGMLDMRQHFSFKEDRSLATASLVCHNSHNVLKRQDSHTALTENQEVLREDFTASLRAIDIVLLPGDNEIVVSCKAEAHGTFNLTQLFIRTGQLELVMPKLAPSLVYQVVYEAPTISLERAMTGELLAGIHQEMVLAVKSGSMPIADGTTLKICAVPGLLLQEVTEQEDESEANLQTEIECKLPAMAPFQSITRKIDLLAELGPQKDASTIRLKVSISCPWSPEPIDINLQFAPPFMTLHRLHTASTRKFIQVSVYGLHSEEFELQHQNLSVVKCPEVVMVPLNLPDKELIISTGRTAWYMWEFVSNLMDSPNLELEFTVKYKWRPKQNGINFKLCDYRYNFTIGDYRTLFTIHSKVEPKGSEFCRTGNMCHMHVQITRSNPSPSSSLMYEVVADQTSWAVCGRTAGVVSLESTSKHSVILDVMPLTSGFLPLPAVRLSKYIPAEQTLAVRDSPKRIDPSAAVTGSPRLEPFSQGQVYNWSDALQVHVIPAPSSAAELLVP